ncbi:MAG: hypothetical protein GEV03_10305 [Streptosporangiales bacterium]|nr:hypothetical protein [Streptosporangiales bacterium]
MPSDAAGLPTTLRPIPGKGWPWSAYSHNVSLTIDDRTLIVTDEAGHPHHLSLGNEPGQVLELSSWEVILGPGAEGQRTERCIVAVDIDDEPLLVLLPTDRWPTIGIWAQVHGIDPMARGEQGEYGPLQVTPSTLIVGKKRPNWPWAIFMLWFIASGFWLFSRAFWDVPLWAVFLPFLGTVALLVLVGEATVSRARRMEEAQLAAWEPVIPESPPPWLTRTRKARPRTVSSRARAQVVLRPDKTNVLRSDGYGRNVSLTVDGRTLIVTDEAGQAHQLLLGDQAGQVRVLDACTWTKEQGPDRARRKDDYLVGVDINRTAICSIAAFDRWDQRELRVWVDIHGLRLTWSKDMEPDEAAEYVPHVGPNTLVIGTHRRTYTHWLWMVAWWTLGILWLAVSVALNVESNDRDIPAWIALAPLLASLFPTGILLWREARGNRERDRRLTAWHMLDSR